MTYWTLIRRSLRFHARAHFGVLLGAAIGTTALTGALIVGDSVKQTLRARALARLGPIHFALHTPDRLFRADLGKRMATAAAIPYAPPNVARKPTLVAALMLPGVATRPDASARVNQVTILGVESPAWPLLSGWSSVFPGLKTPDGRAFMDEVTRLRVGYGDGPLTSWQAGESVLINETLARQLRVRRGDEIILRIRKPSALGLEAAISPRDQDTVALRLVIGAVIPSAALGDFSLMAQPLPAANLFLPLDFLSQKLGFAGSANLLVAGPAMSAPRRGRLYNTRQRAAAWLSRWAPTRRRVAGLQHSTYIVTDNESFLSKAARMVGGRGLIKMDDAGTLLLLQSLLQKSWLPEDAGISVRAVEQPQTATGGEYVPPSVEISTSRIFLEPAIAGAALKPRTNLLYDRDEYRNDNRTEAAFSGFVTNGSGVFTYLANLIRSGNYAAPYSMVTAAGPPYVPPEVRDDEILVNDWLANDLQIKPGDSLQLSYYVADSGARLTERTNSFHVKDIVPLKGIYADRTLMPDFPGLAKAESTHDWDGGFPLVYPIRDKDEAYWKEHRGTPKAYITLAAGQQIWGNRFGSLTAIRYSVPGSSFPSVYRDAVYKNLLANLNPSDFALRFDPVRVQALRAAEQSQDFGQLFLAFSIFLVVSALLLMALLFQFGLEQRMSETGTLLALGFTPKQVRRLRLSEGIALALLGGLIGTLGGLGYAKAMLWALTTVWRSAVNASTLEFHAAFGTLAAGFAASVIVAVLTIWLALRKQARQPITALLAGTVDWRRPVTRRRRHKESLINSDGGTDTHNATETIRDSLRRLRQWVGSGFVGAALCIGAAACMILWSLAKRDFANAEIFFGAGAMLLTGGLLVCSVLLGALASRSNPAELTRSGLAISGAARRRSRSVATVALLASGSFVIAALGIFRLDANRDASRPSSGTGGFSLIGSSALPLLQDLNTPSGRAASGLSEADLSGARLVSLRVHEGEEASCLNLNRAQKPRLLGVNPEALAGRFTFAAAAKGQDRRKGWRLLLAGAGRGEAAALDHPTQSAADEIPAIGDAASIQWALGKKLGDTLDYTDERGRTFKIRLVGGLANSILQGSLIIDENEFVKRFPNQSGYQFFLIDTATNKVAGVSAVLSRALQDIGFEATPTVERLNAFNAVQNTYLGTFQILGGLGLLLGSAGLGVVVLRNVLERRAELGLFLALGFRRRTIYWLIFGEHAALLAVGLSLGIISAAVAVLPSLLAPGAQPPSASVVLTLIAVGVSGLLWTLAATDVSLRGELLNALRNE